MAREYAPWIRASTHARFDEDSVAYGVEPCRDWVQPGTSGLIIANSRNRPLAVSLVGAALFLLSGCPEQTSKSEPSKKVCTGFGQQCEVSPGKLGSCVIRDDCSGKDCYVCQSQH